MMRVSQNVRYTQEKRIGIPIVSQGAADVPPRLAHFQRLFPERHIGQSYIHFETALYY